MGNWTNQVPVNPKKNVIDTSENSKCVVAAKKARLRNEKNSDLPTLTLRQIYVPVSDKCIHFLQALTTKVVQKAQQNS